MNIVFCGDYGVWHALHVAAFSVLKSFETTEAEPHFHIASDVFHPKDIEVLGQTLAATGKKHRLSLVRIDPSVFSGFKPLNGSLGAYYKLVLPSLLEVDRFLYLDADILCDVNLAPLARVNLQGKPAGWVPEAPMDLCVDRDVAQRLGNSPKDSYFNSGVLLVDRGAWIRERITEKCLDYLSRNEALIREQSALNVVLHGKSVQLEECYNTMTIIRRHWPAQTRPLGTIGHLLHFADYPKPWDFLGEWIHPQHMLWRRALRQTAVSNFFSWQKHPSRRIPKTMAGWRSYQKTLKDKVLFELYRRGWFLPKAVPQAAWQPKEKNSEKN